jgi:hypothetical protein
MAFPIQLNSVSASYFSSRRTREMGTFYEPLPMILSIAATIPQGETRANGHLPFVRVNRQRLTAPESALICLEAAHVGSVRAKLKRLR